MFSAFARRTARRGAAPRRPKSSRLAFDLLEARDVPATGLGVANDYSAFVLQDMNVFSSDVQGRVAVGGNASLTAYAVGDRLPASNGTRDDLIVGGNLSFTNGQLFAGNAVYAGTGNFGSFGIPNGTTRQGNALDFNAAGNALRALSDQYAALPANGSVVNQYGTIILTGTQGGQNVFTVPASLLWNANNLIIRAPAGSSVIVNVTGADARMQFMGFNLEGVHRDNVILNFPQATRVTFQGIGIQANVLAPRATVDFSNGQLNGTLVACNWTGFGQINLDHPPPPPPPPPPNPPARGSRGRASLTVSGRPWKLKLFSASTAALASASFGISTNPKPRDRPVSRSRITWARATVPCWPNSCIRSSFVQPQERLPT